MRSNVCRVYESNPLDLNSNCWTLACNNSILAIELQKELCRPTNRRERNDTSLSQPKVLSPSITSWIEQADYPPSL